MEVLKNVFSSGDKKAKNKKRKSGSALPNRNSVSGVDVPRVRSSSSSSCIQESEREGFVFVERLKEGGSATDVTSGSSNNPLSPPASAASSSAAASASDADAAVAARLSDLDLRRVNVETEAVQRTSPTRAAATALAATSTASSSSTAPTTADGDHFLTLKNVKGGFCLDKKLEKKVNKRSRCSGVADEEDEEPWLKPPLDLDEFDYDFSLEKSVLRDFS